MGISGNIRGLYAPFLDALGNWNDAVGNKYTVYVGVRTLDEQQRLYNLYQLWLSSGGKEGRSILAAKPGPKARHMYGLAVDVRPNPVSEADARLLKNFGGTYDGQKWTLLMDVPGEPWHIYPSNAGYLIDNGICTPIRDSQLLSNVTLPYLRRGARGELVRSIQKWALLNFSYAVKTIGQTGGADGIWGAGFNAWLVQFCKNTGLVSQTATSSASITIGPKVWAEFGKHGFRVPTQSI